MVVNPSRPQPLTAPLSRSRYVILRITVAEFTGRNDGIKIYHHLALRSEIYPESTPTVIPPGDGISCASSRTRNLFGRFLPSYGIYRRIVCYQHSRCLPRTEDAIDRGSKRHVLAGRTASADSRIRPTATHDHVRPPQSPMVRSSAGSCYPIRVYIGMRRDPQGPSSGDYNYCSCY